MTEPYVDPAHRVPDELWTKVVRDADAIYEKHLAAKTGGASSPAGPLINMLGSGKHSGVSGIPTQLEVLHSGECPLRGGYAQSLTSWGNIPIEQGGPIASWHWFIDPIARVRMIEEVYTAWHASEANPISEGFEQAGYARYTRAEWLTPDGLLQMESLAYTMAQRAKINGIPARWLTNAEVTRATNGDRTVKGFCTHRQIDPETRTDPGNGYPYDLLMAKVKAYMGGTVTPTSSTKEWYLMPDIPRDNLLEIAAAVNNAEFRQAIRDEVLGAPILSTDGKKWPLRAHVQGNTKRSVQTLARLEGLEEVVRQLAAGQGVAIDYAKVEQAFKNALAGSKLSVDFQGPQ